MNNDELIKQARERYKYANDSQCEHEILKSWKDILALADALEAAGKEIERRQRIHEDMVIKFGELAERAEKTESYICQLKKQLSTAMKERDTYKAETEEAEAGNCWIPVKGRPPDRNGRYLVSLGVKAPEELGGNQTLVRIIRYFEGEWKYPVHLPTWINKEITQEITYWRPLPEPPEAITDDAL